MKRVAKGLLIVICCLGAAPVVMAAGEASLNNANNAALSNEAIDQRIRFIENRLDAHQMNGEIWYWSWMTINGGSMVGYGIAATNASDQESRVNYAAQSTLGAIGVADLLFRPLEARHGTGPIRHLPESNREEKLAKLHAAEDLLHANAQRAAERYHWGIHLANFLLNAAAGAATGIAGDPGGGVVTAILGTLGGEAFIWTEPAGPEKDWKKYQEMAAGRTSGRIKCSVQPAGPGLMVRIRW